MVILMMDKYKAGDVWLYQQRKGEENSTVIINKVDIGSDHLPIYHITIRDVKIANPENPIGFSDMVGHVAVSIEALEKSLTVKIASEEADNEYLEGYEYWYEECLEGRVSIVDCSITEILYDIEQMFNTEN